MNYYQLNLGSWSLLTGRLSAIELGVFSRLVSEYLSTESPLGGDSSLICKIAQARTHNEKAAVKSVLETMFVLEGGSYVSPYCETLIAQYREKLPTVEARRERERKRIAEARARQNPKPDSGYTHDGLMGSVDSEEKQGVDGNVARNILQHPCNLTSKPVTINIKKKDERKEYALASRAPNLAHPTSHEDQFSGTSSLTASLTAPLTAPLTASLTAPAAANPPPPVADAPPVAAQDALVPEEAADSHEPIPTYRVGEESAKKRASKRRKAIEQNLDHLLVGVAPQVLGDWQEMRRHKRAIVNETVIAGLIREADRAGLSLEAVMRLCVERNWVGFNAEWHLNNIENGGRRDRTDRSRQQVWSVLCGESEDRTGDYPLRDIIEGR